MPMFYLCRLALTVVGLLFVPRLLVGQSEKDQEPPPPRYGIRVDFVEVDVRVTDVDGTFVTGLEREDFELFEDGRRQEIEQCILVEISGDYSTQSHFFRDVEPSVASNTLAPEGRIYALLLDDLHTAAQRSGPVRELARRFIEKGLAAGDVAAVLHTSGRSAQGLTENRERLLASVDQFLGRKLRSPSIEILERLGNFPPGVRKREIEKRRLELVDGRPRPNQIRDPLALERVSRARVTLDVILSVSGALSEIRSRRKSIVYFGEGLDATYDVPLGLRHDDQVLERMNEAIGAAGRANLTVYAVDPRGLAPGSVETLRTRAVPGDVKDVLGMVSLETALQLETSLGQNSLTSISEATGGFAVLNQNDLSASLDRIVEGNSRYYMLGYYPAAVANDGGRFREIEVRVKRPGTRVEARRGYVAEETRAVGIDASEVTPAVVQLARRPLPVPDTSLRVAALPFRSAKNEGAEVVLVVEMSTDGFSFEEREGKLHDRVELYAVALGQDGKPVQDIRREFQLALRPRTRELMSRSGLRLGTTLDLPPGRFELRVATLEKGARRQGSLFYDIQVPDYRDDQLCMSPIVVSSGAESQVPILATEDDKRAVGLLPSTHQFFSSSEELWAFTEVYWSSSLHDERLDLFTTLKATDQTVVFESKTTDVGQGMSWKRALPHRVKIPLAPVPPGEYLLEIRVETQSGGEETRRRALVRIK